MGPIYKQIATPATDERPGGGGVKACQGWRREVFQELACHVRAIARASA